VVETLGLDPGCGGGALDHRWTGQRAGSIAASPTQELNMRHNPARRPTYAALLVCGVLGASLLTDPSSLASSGPPADRAAVQARPFRATSYWNTPLGRAPRDPHNGRYIRDAQKLAHSQHYLKLVIGRWGMPTYRSGAGDPVFRINPAAGPTVRIHIPRGARPMPTTDAAMVVHDRSTRQVVNLTGAHFHKARHRWTARAASRYFSNSNGIAQGLPTGTRGNLGHRGIPGSVQAVTRKEIRRGVIRHRLEIYWWETAPRTPSGREAYFPMTGSEASLKHGVVPEGIVIRIKRSVNLRAKHLNRAAFVIARALQRYGAVIGDNSGSGNNLKLQSNARWAGVLTATSLRSIPWKDYVFVKGGFRP
jgi:hypothetical protein